jgi:putative ABC transport system permease protein
MRVEALRHFSRRWLRAQLAPELLAGAGIAIGVALVVAVVVANTSATASLSQVVHGVAGRASLQLYARDDRGFPSDLLAAVRSTPSVERAAGLLEQGAVLAGPRARRSVLLVGADASLAELGGSLTQDFRAGHGLMVRNALVLPRVVADGVGFVPGRDPTTRLRVRGRAARVPIAAVLGPDVLGAMADASVVTGSVGYVQRLTRLPGRLTHIFVEPKPGRTDAARRALIELAHGRLAVTSLRHESRILAQLSAPHDQSAKLFAAISAIVGLLLAFSATLLTIPERRRAIAEFRTHGFSARQIASIVGAQALLLGTVASAAGLGLGLVLARAYFSGRPADLLFAYPLGFRQAAPVGGVALVFLGGVVATCLAAAQPLLDLCPGRASDAVYREEGEPGQALSPTARRVLGASAMLLLLGATALVARRPSSTVLGIAALALSVVLALPAALGLVVAAVDRLAVRHRGLNMLAVAAMALRATRLRAIALAATGAVAVFGSVAIGGTHRDLVRGVHRSFAQQLGTADLWVTADGDAMTTESFPAGDALARIRRVPGVASARPYFGSLLDVGRRRLSVIAHSPRDRSMLPPGEVESGAPDGAEALLRRGGAIAVSQQVAAEQHVAVGGMLALPTPTGTHRYRLAATLSNLGWGPGVAIMNGDDYRRAWEKDEPSAFEVDVQPGRSPAALKSAVRRAIGPDLALRVQTAAERGAQYDRLARDGLGRLTQISTLLLLTAAFALATATGAAIWQRRVAFADYRLQGFTPKQLCSAMLIESGVVLVTGCTIGALAGIYGELLLGRWLRMTTGFPALFSPSLVTPLATIALVVAAALCVAAVPGWRIARSPLARGLHASLSDE